MKLLYPFLNFNSEAIEFENELSITQIIVWGISYLSWVWSLSMLVKAYFTNMV